MGRRRRRPRSGLRQAMARMGRRRTGAPTIRSPGSSKRSAATPNSRRLDRLGVERGRDRAHEACPMPLPVPVLRQRRPAVVPALPALGRHLSRRAVQHRELRASDPSRRARMRARGRRVRAYVRRRASLPQSRGPGARAARREALARCRASSSATLARSSTSTRTRSRSRATIPGPRSRRKVAV